MRQRAQEKGGEDGDDGGDGGGDDGGGSEERQDVAMVADERRTTTTTSTSTSTEGALPGEGEGVEGEGVEGVEHIELSEMYFQHVTVAPIHIKVSYRPPSPPIKTPPHTHTPLHL